MSISMISHCDTWTAERKYRPSDITKSISFLLFATGFGFYTLPLSGDLKKVRKDSLNSNCCNDTFLDIWALNFTKIGILKAEIKWKLRLYFKTLTYNKCTLYANIKVVFQYFGCERAVFWYWNKRPVVQCVDKNFDKFEFLNYFITECIKCPWR